jgi:hypothetical protein
MANEEITPTFFGKRQHGPAVRAGIEGRGLFAFGVPHSGIRHILNRPAWLAQIYYGSRFSASTSSRMFAAVRWSA